MHIGSQASRQFTDASTHVFVITNYLRLLRQNRDSTYNTVTVRITNTDLQHDKHHQGTADSHSEYTDIH